MPDFQWQDEARVLPSFLDGVPKTRAALQQAGVPGGHVVYRDLTELDSSMRAAVAVTRARDDSSVMAVYFGVKTAFDRTGESCGVLERSGR